MFALSALLLAYLGFIKRALGAGVGTSLPRIRCSSSYWPWISLVSNCLAWVSSQNYCYMKALKNTIIPSIKNWPLMAKWSTANLATFKRQMSYWISSKPEQLDYPRSIQVILGDGTGMVRPVLQGYFDTLSSNLLRRVSSCQWCAQSCCWARWCWIFHLPGFRLYYSKRIPQRYSTFTFRYPDTTPGGPDAASAGLLITKGH